MGLIDKLKNVFFEEVEEEEEDVPKSYAKKVEVPKKKNMFFKNDDEEKVSKKDLDNFLEDVDSPKIEETKEENEEKEVEVTKSVPMMFDVDDFYDEENVSFVNEVSEEETKNYKRENRKYSEEKELYPDKKEVSYADSINNKPTYAYTKTTYYEERETKGFKPSPIISPIYGILDKNYRKEEVVTKRETRISGTYSKLDLDSVRNKAFATSEKKEITRKQETKKYNNENKVYDVNNSKPQVSKVTLADADEYYNDLGLAYNVDYSDASRGETRSSKYNTKEKKKEKKDVDDNLFDLIDSMYSKED